MLKERKLKFSKGVSSFVEVKSKSGAIEMKTLYNLFDINCTKHLIEWTEDFIDEDTGGVVSFSRIEENPDCPFSEVLIIHYVLTNGYITIRANHKSIAYSYKAVQRFDGGSPGRVIGKKYVFTNVGKSLNGEIVPLEYECSSRYARDEEQVVKFLLNAIVNTLNTKEDETLSAHS